MASKTLILFSAWSTSSLLAIPNDWLYRIEGQTPSR